MDTLASTFVRLAAALGLAAAAAGPAPAGEFPADPQDAAHAQARESFKRGRFAEAYGRFVALANTGHAASARQALWMCEHGSLHFGHDWDCGPEQVARWAAAAGIHAPQLPGHAAWAPRAAPLAAGRR